MLSLIGWHMHSFSVCGAGDSLLLDEILQLIPKCQSKRSHRDSQTETVISILCWKGKWGGTSSQLIQGEGAKVRQSQSGQASWLGGALLLWL